MAESFGGSAELRPKCDTIFTQCICLFCGGTPFGHFSFSRKFRCGLDGFARQYAAAAEQARDDEHRLSIQHSTTSQRQLTFCTSYRLRNNVYLFNSLILDTFVADAYDVCSAQPHITLILTTCRKATKINDQEYELFNANEFINTKCIVLTFT